MLVDKFYKDSLWCVRWVVKQWLNFWSSDSFLDKEIMWTSCLLSNSVQPLCQHASSLNSRKIYIYTIYHIINAAWSIWSNHYFLKSFPNEQLKDTYPMSANVCDNDCLYLLLLFQMMQHHHFRLQYWNIEYCKTFDQILFSSCGAKTIYSYDSTNIK